MSKTLSVLIVENFVINEGPKWDKFKKGMKKVGRGDVTAAALGSVVLANAIEESFLIPKSLKIKYHNDRIKANTKKLIKAKNAAKEDKAAAKIDAHSLKYARNKYGKYEKWADSFEAHLREVREKLTEFEKVNSDELDGKLKKTSATQEENRAKSDNETLTTKESLKERLNIVKSGMFLNEEDADTTVLEKERYSDGHTPESIATLHNVPVQDILDQIERGIEIEREHTTDKAEARLIAMDHLVELPDYYTRLDKMEEEGKMENSINESEKKQTAKQNKKLSKIVLEHPELFLEEELLNEGKIKKALGTLGTLALGASLLNTGANLKDRHDWKSHAENMSHQEVMKTDDWLNRTENIDRKDDDDYKEKERQLQLAKDRQEAFKKAKKNPFQKSVTYGDKTTEGLNDRPFTQKVGDLARSKAGK